MGNRIGACLPQKAGSPCHVHRQGESVAAYSGLGAQSPVDGFAQHDRHVLHRVVFVDVQIAAGLHFERHAAVVGDLRQHVVQKTQSGRNPVAAVSIVAVPVVVVPFVTAAVVDPAVVSLFHSHCY